MALNAIEKQLLRKAREFVCCGRRRGICWALNDASNYFSSDDERYNDACERLGLYIMDQLHPSLYLNSWLANNGFVHIASDINAMRRARIAWIDWMLGKEDESAKCLKDDTWLKLLEQGQRSHATQN